MYEKNNNKAIQGQGTYFNVSGTKLLQIILITNKVYKEIQISLNVINTLYSLSSNFVHIQEEQSLGA